MPSRNPSTGWHPADDSWFGSQDDVVEDVFLRGDTGDALRHADAQIDDGVGSQFHGGPPRDHLANRQLEVGNRRQRYSQFSTHRRRVLGSPGLGVVLGGGHHDAVDEDPGDLDILGVEHRDIGDALDLHDDESTPIVHRGRDGQGFEEQCFTFHGDVAVGISGRPSQERDVQPLECLVEEIVLAVDRDQFDEVLRGLVVDLAASVARVDERVHTDAGDEARLARGGVAEQLRDDTLGQVVRLDLVFHGHLAELNRHPPVASDGPFQ